MKKLCIILLIITTLCCAACASTQAASGVNSEEEYPNIGQNNTDYDIGQLDILNKLQEVKDAGKADVAPYVLGSVTEYKTLTENGSEYILANVLRHTMGQENYGGLVDEYYWIIHELGTQNYTWLKANAELLDFTSANEISFQTGYNSESPYYAFPNKYTFVNTGSRWAVFSETVWLNAEKTPVDFGLITFKNPDEAAQVELAKYPFSLSEIYFSPDRIGLITTGGAGNEPMPYIRIQRGDSINKLQITLQDCSLALSSIPEPSEYCVITDYTTAQDGKNTVITITFSDYRYYRAALNDLGAWSEGMSTEIIVK